MLSVRPWRAIGAALVATSLVAASTAFAAGAWNATGKMSTIRYGHTVTALADGRAVAIGGFDEYNPLPGTEIFNPAGGAWTKGPNLAAPRFRHTATTLPDGRVLIVGGRNNTNAVATAEVFNPADNSIAPAGTLATPRYDHTAVGLPDGRVFIIGGNTDQSQAGVDENEVPIYQNPALASVEMWDPASSTFAPAGNLTLERAEHRSVLLPDGRILVVGGVGNTAETGPDGTTQSTSRWSAEIYDPAAQAASPTAPMATNRVDFSITLIPEGAGGPARVLVAGGHTDSDSIVGTAETFDPAAGAWTAAGTLAQPRIRAITTVLASGNVLLAGGLGEQGTLQSSELFDAAAGAWSDGSAMAEQRDRAAGALLPDGRILVAGGFTSSGFMGLGGGLDTAELFAP